MSPKRLVVIAILLVTACGDGGLSATGALPVTCADLQLPTAPQDWYAETPIYVGNEMPIEEVRQFASSLEGYVDIWIDREHNGWITVGFVDADIESHQTLLESGFPDDGVVAVEIPYTPERLDQVATRLSAELPDDMDASNVDYLRGSVVVYGGLLTEERMSLIGEVAGSDPVCVDGMDPSLVPDQGRQEGSGEGWVFLGVVDAQVGEVPVLITDSEALSSLWDTLGLSGTAPDVDYERRVAVAFPLGYSGSCPDTRFDGLSLEGDRLMPVIAHTTVAQGCTADYNPRTYVVAVDRQALPPPPFYLAEWEHSSRALRVNVDLRTGGLTLGEDGATEVDIEKPREATRMPLVIETGYPWTITVPSDCDPSYLGEINGVGWHSDLESFPQEWADTEVDGLIDLELLLEEGPTPSLTVSAGGVEVDYQPGATPGPDCRR
jgi:hypothetical protein